MSRFAPPEKRKRAERRGRWSEWVAAVFLMMKGYRILSLRYRVRAGEIDIIARRGDVVAFVEVKARRDLMAAIDAVTFTSQNRIRAAGDHWLSRQPDASRLSLRYDIVAIVPRAWPRHIEGAF
ncbi:MAG: YraN family protein [Rhizobium sp.]|nr:YraN family protein [Rhizobium sp.]